MPLSERQAKLLVWISDHDESFPELFLTYRDMLDLEIGETDATREFRNDLLSLLDMGALDIQRVFPPWGSADYVDVDLNEFRLQMSEDSNWLRLCNRSEGPSHLTVMASKQGRRLVGWDE